MCSRNVKRRRDFGRGLYRGGGIASSDALADVALLPRRFCRGKP